MSDFDVGIISLIGFGYGFIVGKIFDDHNCLKCSIRSMKFWTRKGEE